MQLTTSYQLISSFNLTYGAIRTYAKYSSQSITDNTTTYQIKQVYYCNVSGGYTGFDRATAVLDGTEKSYTSYTRMYYGETTIQELNRVIEHNQDGSSPSKNIATSWNATFGGSGSTNVNVTFPTINRYAVLTLATDFNDEANPYIYYSNPAGNSVTRLEACISLDGSYDDVPYREISKTGTSYTFYLTETDRTVLRNASANSKSIPVIFYLRTLINGVTYFSTMTKTMYIMGGYPTFSVSYQDTNATTTNITGDNQKIIQNNSTLQLNITSATAYKGASLSTIKATINGVDTIKPISSSTLNIDIGTVNLSSNTTIPIVLTDTRGNTSQIGLNLTVLSYQLPSAIINLRRKQNYYTETDITPDASYSSLDGNNTLTIQYRYKKSSDPNYGAYASLTNYTTTTFNADNLYSWDIQVLLTDRIGSTTYNLTLNVGTPILFIDRQKYSVGINCLPQGNNTLELNGIDISNTYSLNELKVGTWLNTKPIYRKVVSCGALPNNDAKNVAHGISNLEFVQTLRLMCITGTTFYEANMTGTPLIFNGGVVAVRIKDDNIQIATTFDATQHVGYAIIEYTKSTD